MAYNYQPMTTETYRLKGIASEGLTSPEKPRIKLVKWVIVSGDSYTGKDTLANELKARHGFIVDNGRDQFERRTGVETGHMIREQIKHIRFDGYQAKRFRKSTPGDARIWQTRVGGVILAEERDRRLRERRKRIVDINWAMQKGEIPLPPIEDIPAVSVLIVADRDKRIDRAHQAAVIDAKSESKPIPTREKIEVLMDERSKGDVGDWAPLHSRYIRVGDDPFRRDLRRPNGSPVYDIVIDTTKRNIQEAADYFEQELERFSVLETIVDEPQDTRDVGAPYPSELQLTLSIGEPLSESR